MTPSVCAVFLFLMLPGKLIEEMSGPHLGSQSWHVDI